MITIIFASSTIIGTGTNPTLVTSRTRACLTSFYHCVLKGLEPRYAAYLVEPPTRRCMVLREKPHDVRQVKIIESRTYYDGALVMVDISGPLWFRWTRETVESPWQLECDGRELTWSIANEVKELALLRRRG